MEEAMPKVYQELKKIFVKLENHYRDMQDIEFTVENNKLWMLQTRSGKRTAKSAIKIATDMFKENSTIVSGSGKKSDIEARCAQIKQQVEETTSDYTK